MTTEQERFERSCEILSSIVDRAPTSDELLDLSALLGLSLSDWYYPEESPSVLEIIDWNERRAA